MKRPEIFTISEQIMDETQEGLFPKRFAFDGHTYVLYKNVFSPIVFKGWTVYIENLPLHEGDSFLDMGCGCGILGIAACFKYKLKKAVCCDVNGYAVKNAKRNVQLLHLEDKVSVFHSDVFSNVPNQKFDVLFWNAPYFDGVGTVKKVLYKSAYDPNYTCIKRFINDGQKYLKPNGKIMLGFSSGKYPLEHARKLINEIGYDFDIFYQGKDSYGYKQEILNIFKIRKGK